MVSGTLYTYPDNFRAYKALVAAQYSGSDVKVASNFVFGETNKTESFLQKFPSGKVPAFESSDGHYLQDSNAIAYYVSNTQLRGKTEIEKAQVLQWIGFADTDILPAACSWVFPIWGILECNKETEEMENAKKDVQNVLKLLNKHLATRTYLVGERITLADIVVHMHLLHLVQYVLDPTFRKPFRNVIRWFTTIANQPEVKAVVPNYEICKEKAEYDPKKYQEFQAKIGSKDKKPTEAPAQEAAPPAPKDDAPPRIESSFIMDDFKRFYSNEDEAKSIPYFWEKFDPKNYSIWFGEYKYNDELQKVFMSCNLIGGMFQRLDKMRKIAFASSCVFGTDNDNSISGVWVWLGQDLAFTQSPDWSIDYESYSWTKLDPKQESTKKLVEQYFSWTGTDSKGRAFNQGKIFK